MLTQYNQVWSFSPKAEDSSRSAESLASDIPPRPLSEAGYHYGLGRKGSRHEGDEAMNGMGSEGQNATTRVVYAQDDPDMAMTDAGPSTAPLVGSEPSAGPEGASTWFRED